jgi:hypothetical protein
MLSHPHPIHTNMAQHRLAIKNSIPPIPTTNEKQPKPKKHIPYQPKDGTGTLRSHPSPQKEKTESSFQEKSLADEFTAISWPICTLKFSKQLYT